MEFSKHLVEAIIINLARLVPYSEASTGKSIPISLILISWELISLPVALIYDFIALFYKMRGEEFMQEEFISMDEIPDFKSFERIEGEFNFLDPEVSLQSLELDKLEKTVSLVEKSLLSQRESIAPMRLHIWESFLRAYDLWKIYESPTKKKLSHLFLETHIVCIPLAKLLDRMAEGCHRQGVPILLRDVPVIPRYRG